MKFSPLIAIAISAVASSADATVVTDQSYIGPSGKAYSFDYPGDYLAQTFTVHNSGQLTSIGLQISHPRAPFPNNPLQIQLTRTNAAGDPLVADVLATSNINPSVVTYDYGGLPMVDVDLHSQHVQVQLGDQLAIVLSSSDVGYDWNTSINDSIPGGRFSVYSPKTFGNRWLYQWIINDPTQTWDAGYRITIDTVPEPATIGLLALTFCAAMLQGHAGIVGHRGLPARGNRSRLPEISTAPSSRYTRPRRVLNNTWRNIEIATRLLRGDIKGMSFICQACERFIIRL
jgi:hypothetical protein